MSHTAAAPDRRSSCSLSLDSLQPLRSRRIEFAFEILLQGVEEDPIVGRGVGEKGHRRAELQIIGKAEDLFDRTPLTRFTSLVHSVSREPRTGCAR